MNTSTSKSWVNDLQNELDLTCEDSVIPRSVYRLPEFIKESCGTKNYVPQVVSIGPYHHGAQRLKKVEKLKRKVLRIYLHQINKTLNEAAEEMGKEAREMMNAYDDLDERWTNDDAGFTKLMVLDGCFLLGLLYSCFSSMNHAEVGTLYYCYMKDMASVLSKIQTDALLLENQLPRRALEVLVELGGEEDSQSCVSNLLLPNQNTGWDYSKYQNSVTHILEGRWLMNSAAIKQLVIKDPYFRYASPPTITELVEAGVTIVKSPQLSRISFKNGTLTLPQIMFTEDFMTTYYNLMAFETMHNLDPEIHSYMIFMDCLISTNKDVEILRKVDVISGGTSNDKEVANFFNKVCRKTYPPTRKYRHDGIDIAKLLRDYCGRWQNRWRASFQRAYLISPWTFLSLVGAIILLILTVLSTVYAMLAYYDT